MSDNAAYQASEIQSVNTGAFPNRSEFPAALATSASLQMAEYWHQTSMATGSLSDKPLLSMEIAALAARPPEC
jgi:hypothetical protein